MLKTTAILFDIRDAISITYRWYQGHDPTYESIYVDAKRITILIAKQIYTNDVETRNRILYDLSEFVYDYSVDACSDKLNRSINRLIHEVQDEIIEIVTGHFSTLKSRDIIDIIPHKGSYMGIVVASPRR